jgi:hypothetical protein
MANAKETKPKKGRAKNYDTKLKINGSFNDVMKVFVDPMRQLKEEPKKKNNR